MLHILLTFLKIIGIIILAILGILVLLLLVVLLVPLRYEVKASSDGDIKKSKLEIKFSWFLHLLAGQVAYMDEKLDYEIRILWKKISADTTEKKEKNESESVEKAKTDTTKTEEKDKADEIVDSVLEKTDPEKITENVLDKAEKKKQEKNSADDETKENKLEKIKCTIKEVCDKIKLILEFLQGEAHKAAFSRLKKELLRLLKFLEPKKINGKIRFGTGDPYQTGQILAVLSVLYPLYAENFEIYPEFEEKIIEGNIYIKGHVRAVYAVIMAFNMIIDKNVRTTIKDVKSLL